jgi:WD40 repeat protein/uncharacterized protein YkvS
LFQQIYGKLDIPVYSTLVSKLMPWRWWKGASDDVMSLAWSEDGTRFAAGAISQDHYNRKNNLVLGNLTRNSLTELPGHYITYNSDQSIAHFEDHHQHATVSHTEWIGQQLFTASYDKTVKIWDIEQGATCVKTLKHDSEVISMAYSTHAPNLLATASKSFSLWDLRDEHNPICMPLPIQRAPRQKALDLVATDIAWGQGSAMGRILVGGMGMAERNDELQEALAGHLQVWGIEESTISTRRVLPNSQHIFHIAWHPTEEQFATASSTLGLMLPRNFRTSVQVYDLSSNKSVITNRFPCPAYDINQVTFCPSGPYVTASCTDRNTYVWDERNAEQVLHTLSHGPSVLPVGGYQLENEDYGVGAALWGTTIDQFYTGSSDGVLKQWDILRAPEDVCVGETARFGAGITRGLFSDDKSHLLIGEAGGGIHVLSSGPCSDPEPAEMEFFHAPVSASSEHQSSPVDSYANELLHSGQLALHPIYGPIQGPQYSGPFAGWARGIEQEQEQKQVLRDIPLLEEYRLRQFDGPPVNYRHSLSNEAKANVQGYFDIAQARSQLARHLQREKDRTGGGGINKSGTLSSTSSCPSSASKRPTKQKAKTGRKVRREKGLNAVITKINEVIIDLTIESSCNTAIDLTIDAPVIDLTSETGTGLLCKEALSACTTCTYNEDMEEDYWWPENSFVDANLPRRLMVQE